MVWPSLLGSSKKPRKQCREDYGDGGGAPPLENPGCWAKPQEWTRGFTGPEQRAQERRQAGSRWKDLRVAQLCLSLAEGAQVFPQLWWVGRAGDHA